MSIKLKTRNLMKAFKQRKAAQSKWGTNMAHKGSEARISASKVLKGSKRKFGSKEYRRLLKQSPTQNHPLWDK